MTPIVNRTLTSNPTDRVLIVRIPVGHKPTPIIEPSPITPPTIHRQTQEKKPSVRLPHQTIMFNLLERHLVIVIVIVIVLAIKMRRILN